MVSALQAIQRAVTGAKSLNTVQPSRGGWWPIISESFAGAWQRNVRVDQEQAIAFHAVFACVSLIAGDIAKLRPMLVELTGDGVWLETTNDAFSPLLRKPNHFQTRQQFIESWVLSRLLRGNAYILKQRDGRGVTTAMHVLDPARVKPLVSDDGAVFYELRADNTAGLTEDGVIVPAREIIHDRVNTLFHPLVGISPLYACGLAATQGLAIQNDSAKFFANGSRPGGILTAPGRIDPDNAERVKSYWDSAFTGDQAGKIAVLGDGLKYEPLALSAEDSQLIEQLKWTAEVVASCFHVPPHMIGVGPVPALGTVEALAQSYYSQCLQGPIEAMEACLDDGLGMSPSIGVEFDLSGLLRMDTASKVKALADAVQGRLMTPNEGRRQLDLPPTEGGDVVFAQQQDFSLAALAERDRNKPFSKPTEPTPAQAESRQAPARLVVTSNGEVSSQPRIKKSMTTRRDADGNLIADIIEEVEGAYSVSVGPDGLTHEPLRTHKSVTVSRDADGNMTTVSHEDE